jgi:3'5'-cyclic nucleotide phosphodiesterase
MSVNKMLGRIVAPSQLDEATTVHDHSMMSSGDFTDDNFSPKPGRLPRRSKSFSSEDDFRASNPFGSPRRRAGKGKVAASTLHDHTYGITSDPLTQFACVFSALVHDVDHPGVPNTQLVKENLALSEIYNGRSVAEQNSVDLAWELLMDSQYTGLQNAICANQEELDRFRQLVVNSVMATDLMDKDLKELRNKRWATAFDSSIQEDYVLAVNRKATIVIEHLIQASDVSHMMQHWYIYRKWNTRLFMEMYKAYKQGRSDKDPATFWYEGEIGFYDFYVIPLAKKLNDCGVFGVSSFECLDYAMKNRSEWERRGRAIVEDMKEEALKLMLNPEEGDARLRLVSDHSSVCSSAHE